jgi:hypothetical protein
MTLVRPPGGANEALHIRILTARAELHTGTQVARQSCPRRWTAIAVGYAVPAGVFVDGAAALATSGRWSLRSVSSASRPADVELVCGRVAPR